MADASDGDTLKYRIAYNKIGPPKADLFVIENYQVKIFLRAGYGSIARRT